jgi:hypothetical protein
MMVALDATIINIALPSAQRALHISDPERQWVICEGRGLTADPTALAHQSPRDHPLPRNDRLSVETDLVSGGAVAFADLVLDYPSAD